MPRAATGIPTRQVWGTVVAQGVERISSRMRRAFSSSGSTSSARGDVRVEGRALERGAKLTDGIVQALVLGDTQYTNVLGPHPRPVLGSAGDARNERVGERVPGLQ